MDNGSAFPHPSVDETNVFFLAEKGMSLRDYFAGQFATSIPVRVWEDASGKTPPDVFELWAKACYAAADALMKERTK